MNDIRYVPPQNIEAEMSVLGGMLLTNSAITTARGIIRREDFYRESHRQIFDGICRLSDKNEPCDLITLTTDLHQAGCLEEVGGAAYLATLVDFVPTAANIAFYCKAVTEKAVERELLVCSQNIVAGLHQNKTAGEIIEIITNQIMAISKPGKREPATAAKLVKDAVKRLEYRHEKRGVIEISYGWQELDAVTNGLHRGDLVIVAGRPSMGKSGFAGNIAENICAQDGGALFFSLEMSKEQLIERHIASVGSVNFTRIRSGAFEPQDWPRMMAGANKLHKYDLFIDDTPAISLHEVRAKAKAIKMKHDNLSVVIVDYIQLMATSNAQNRVQGIGEISRGLKQLARELNLPVVALSQLNRGVDGRDDKKPRMSDLRDSGEIEQDADVILFPFRPAAYCDKCRSKVDNADHDYNAHQSEAELIIAKQRNGEVNLSIPLGWQGRYQRFRDLA